MSTWFEVDYSGRVSPVEVASFTEKTVTIVSIGFRNTRQKRSSSWRHYFPTFDEAKSFALERAVKTVVSLRKQLERANGDLGRIKGMKNPLETQP